MKVLVWFAAAVAVVTTGAACMGDGGTAPGTRSTQERGEPLYLRRACRVQPEWVLRLHRGWKPSPARDSDLILVPHRDNHVGTFVNTSHSGVYEYLQEVPLVFYGPGLVRPLGDLHGTNPADLADIAPTYARLLGLNFPPRDGSALPSSIFESGARAPRLIVTVSIDGGGWNVLDRWPGALPNLARLIERGVSVPATVGSAPSITPPAHTTMSTGAYPRRHGVTAIEMRAENGELVGAFTDVIKENGVDLEPGLNLLIPTINDLWDRATGNRAKVGMITAGNFTIGMLGLGTAHPAGDADILAVFGDRRWTTDRRFFSLPEYVPGLSPQPEIDRIDRSDGRLDGQWRGHAVDEVVPSPVYPHFAMRSAITIMRREGFGADRTADLFNVHIKSPDAAGHKWNMISPEERDVIAATDEALGRLTSWMQGNVRPGRWMLVVTADHGQVPLDNGGWPISQAELVDDLQREFDHVANEDGLIEETSSSLLFLDRGEMQANEIGAGELASFLSDYRLGDNVPEGDEVPTGYAGRVAERVFAAVLPGRALPDIVECTGALDAE